jgi:hypothetical protein
MKNECMRWLTALSLVLLACSGGDGATGGAGDAAVDGAMGDSASDGSGNDGRADGAGHTAVGDAADGDATGGNGSAGDGGTGDHAGGAGDASVDGPTNGDAAGDSGTAGLDGSADTQQIDGGGTIQSLPLSTNDMVFDSTRGVLYATLNPAADAGNSVITIDPASGTVTGAVPVGGRPSVLAINDDCSAVYVGVNTPAGPPTPTPQIDGADSIRRIDLASMTAGPLVSLGANTNSKLSAGQIAAVPGSATQYVVSRRQPGTQPDYAGLALYDGSTQLAQLERFYGSGDSIAFVDHSTLIGCSNLQSPSELKRYRITSTAITPETYVEGVIAGSARTRIAVGSGWIFASDGHALNAATLAPLGRYGDGLNLGSSDVAPLPDPDGATVWFLSHKSATVMALLNFERTTFQLRRTITLGPLPYDSDLPNASPLLRWSPTGFAFRTYEKLYLIKLPN